MECCRCDACGKNFNSELCLWQHEASEKHKRKLQLPFMMNQLHCSTCHVSVIGLDNYQNHVNSMEHSIMVQKKKGFKVTASSTDPTKAVASFDECKSCQKKQLTSSIVPSTQIMRNVEPHSIVRKGGSFAESLFKCNVCVKTFTGPVPYRQHLESNGHKKKIVSDFSKQMVGTGSLSPPDSVLQHGIVHEESSINDHQKWYCDICNKQCSGPIPYNTHLLGKEHSKNLRSIQVDENLKNEVLGPLPSVRNEVTFTRDLYSGSDNEMGESSVNCKIIDSIASPDLSVSPLHKLNITIFQPDEEIVFSNPKKSV